MKYDGDHLEYVLSDGTRLFAVSPIIGIGTDGRVHSGTDQSLEWELPRELTAAQRSEIAHEMILRWKAFGGLP